MTDEIDKITETLKSTEDPFVLADCLTKLAGWASYYGGQMAEVQLNKPIEWLGIKDYNFSWLPDVKDWVKRDKPLSDKHTDIQWAATDEGKKEIELHWKLKRIDQMCIAIRR